MYLEVKDLKKSYGEGGGYVQVLKGITAGVEQGEMCVIQGTSGSGKSTLLNCIGGLDTVDSGSIVVDGQEVAGLNSKALSNYRREKLGFIFQFYNLVPNLTVKENIQVCQYLTKNPLNMEELLQVLGLTEHQNKFPAQLSGGQQQRCAIARALIKNPSLLLCDEPTGALDSRTSRDILILLEDINRQYGTTMLIVTHNNSIKNMVHQVIMIKDGQISKNYRNEKRVPAAELEDSEDIKQTSTSGYPGKPASVSGTVFPGGTGHVYGGGYCGSCRDYYAGDEGERTCPSQRGRTVWRFCSADRKRDRTDHGKRCDTAEGFFPGFSSGTVHVSCLSGKRIGRSVRSSRRGGNSGTGRDPVGTALCGKT